MSAGPLQSSAVAETVSASPDRRRDAILQLHASQHCNLTCRHCYSASGPQRKGTIGIDALSALFNDAAAEGYRILSLSGGEPLLDPSLFDQIALARQQGFRVHLATNGTLADDAKAHRLAGLVDLIAISIDGPPEIHNALRGSPSAFARAVSGARAFRRAGIRVGFLHTVRMATLGHLRWLANFARREEADFLQLHPLEQSGRARSLMAGEANPADLPTRLALMVAILAAEDDLPPIHVDILAVAALNAAPGCRNPLPQPADSLADWIDPLVVEPDGVMVPWTYGIRRDLAIGAVGMERPAAAIERYRTSRLRHALDHARAVRDRVLSSETWPYVNWFAALAEG